ncbi:MAG TPA: glycoside hydrolase family 99-like domain-containing protein [Gaiellaceae bacterium]|nr:glycoside hydrolase family 99-like domain-containing protein [Gaiellaceae bacterium]
MPQPETRRYPYVQRTSRFTIDIARRFFDAWIERFASRRGFLRIDGRPALSILNLNDFVQVYGLAAFRFMLEDGRARIEEALGVEPFFVGLFNRANAYNVKITNKLPVEAATGYGLLPDWLGPPVQDYETLIAKRVGEWYFVQEGLRVPFYPVVCAGWDATVRGERVAELSAMRGFPWRPVVRGVTPELFGRFLDEAIRFIDATHPADRIVFIHAWNEWTEASVIEPSDRFGTAFLDEIRARSSSLATLPAASC